MSDSTPETPDTPGTPDAPQEPARASNNGQPRSWSLRGYVDAKAKPSWFAMALALIFALQTFNETPGPYPLYMNAIAVASTVLALYRAYVARAAYAVLFLPAVTPFVMSLFGSPILDTMDAFAFAVHAAIALLFGFASVSFLKISVAPRR